jgi:hypothetical protein
MLSTYKTVRTLALLALLSTGAIAFGQAPTATGVINATLNHRNGIALVFDTDPNGVSLGAAGSSAATLNFGTISAFGPLSPGVVRTSVTAANFTVRSIFDVQVLQGSVNSNSYRLSASLSTLAPTGLTYKVDSVTLTTANQTIQASAAYDTDIAHNLDLVVSSASPGAGGPAVGTPLTTTINFTATAN